MLPPPAPLFVTDILLEETRSFFSFPGIDLMCRLRETVLEHSCNLIPNDNKNCQIAVSTVVLNYAITSTTSNFDTDLQKQCTTLTSLLIAGLTDQEAKYRTLVCLGTLMEASASNIAEAKKMDMKENVKSAMILAEKEHKVHKVAKLILSRL